MSKAAKHAFTPAARAERAELIDALNVVVERLMRRETVFLARRHVKALEQARSAGDLYFAADCARSFLVGFSKVAPALTPPPDRSAPIDVKPIDAPPPSDEALIAAFVAAGRQITYAPQPSRAVKPGIQTVTRRAPSPMNAIILDLVERGLLPRAALSR